MPDQQATQGVCAVLRTTFQHNRRRARLPPLGAVCRRPSTATASFLVAARSGYALLYEVAAYSILYFFTNIKNISIILFVL